ncbi:MAG: GvpL/GvpF family gas vesicle protein [Verrucomicrobiota bacterium]|jgi:Gas vesicle synthesis protein GvpL/GvpF
MNTDKSGLYIYCIVGTRQERNWRAIGIDRTDVLTISYDDLSMVVSSHPLTRVVINRDNMIAHQKVIERVMQEFDSVLPVRFGTIAASADEIRNLLDRRQREFKTLLRHVERRIELGVKGLWKNMTAIYAEIVRDNPAIEKAKKAAANQAGATGLPARREVGRLVEKALLKKKEQEAKQIADFFQKTVMDAKLSKTGTDEMFINASFLVDRGREKEFDNLMEQLVKRYKDRVLFKYAGPLPVFNFVNIVINPEEWER